MSPSLMLVVIAAAITFAATSGCDTVARISFPTNALNEVQVVGLSPSAGSCGGSSGEAVMRFLLIDDNGTPINQDTELSSGGDISLTRDDITFDGATVYESPDNTCDNSDDCRTGGFVCEPATDGLNNLCRNSSLGGVSSTSDASQLASLDSNQVWALLIEDTASISGRLPSDIEGLNPDFIGGGQDELEPDGIADDDRVTSDSTYSGLNAERATDPDGNAIRAGLPSMASSFANVASNAISGVRTSFGMWTFGQGLGEIESLISTGNFVLDPVQVDAAMDTLRNGTSDSRSIASVYVSMLSIIEGEENLASFGNNAEKYLVVVVDGPDDLRGSGDADAQRIIEAAGDDVHIVFIHIDPPVETMTGSGYDLLPDIPQYARSQEQECTSDADCKNFETCGQVTAYAGTPGAEVNQPADRLEGTYCKIGRDQNGRIGPIAEYAEIACATQGAYIYLPSTEFLGERVGSLPLMMDGFWEVDVAVDPYSRGALSENAPYLLESNMTVTLGGESVPVSLSQNLSIPTSNPRPVLFTEE